MHNNQRIMCDGIALKSSMLFFISVPGKYHSHYLQLMGKIMFFEVKDIVTFFTDLRSFCPVSGGSAPSCLLPS